ncbi:MULTISPECIES: helix-turn-helix domain-containing protein [unclassified Hwanghaeella]|jgi:transcriptional regulator with XRE-family HTH domain|uniref:helix-turn-helix domain-containing protein n=1 Tax=unclassified Hwanghaeella TaxID=2605944 RepID=UPI002693A16C|tara:strand:- start:60261 stop:61154 length:894 start_codon:yes stop_codon:yes gene_type:complete
MYKATDYLTGRNLDRRETVSSFRKRLESAMADVGINQSGLARAIGVDRSTLSQLLSRSADRLPRADTVAAMAVALQVSTDWLLGLAEEPGQGAAILRESIEIARPDTFAGSDKLLEQWHTDAVGYKVRYVPSSLPDLVKTDAVLALEYATYQAKSTEEAKSSIQNRLALSRIPEMEMEICLSWQVLRTFARGQGVWDEFPKSVRLEQLEYMASLLSELYPRVRLFLFDGRKVYAVPYTVFGPRRAAIFLGQMYFVFNTREHIRTLSDHFDSLVRAAKVQAHEMPGYIRSLMAECEEP